MNNFFTKSTAQKMKFSLKDFFSKCNQIRRKFEVNLKCEEILNGKLYFLCREVSKGM